MVSSVVDFILRFLVGFLIAQVTFMIFGLSILSAIYAIVLTLVLFQIVDKDDKKDIK